jgi:Leucine Rich repeat
METVPPINPPHTARPHNDASAERERPQSPRSARSPSRSPRIIRSDAALTAAANAVARKTAKFASDDEDGRRDPEVLLIDHAVHAVVESFEQHPQDLRNHPTLERKFCQQIVDALPITLDLKVAAEYLTDWELAEDWWRRRSLEQAKHHSEVESSLAQAGAGGKVSTTHQPNPRHHGNSWQQTFFEELVENELMTYTPSMDLDDVVGDFQSFAKFVRIVRLPNQRAHIDTRKVLAALPSLEVFELTFSPKTLSGKDSATAFGMKGADVEWLSESAAALEQLQELKIPRNKIQSIQPLQLHTFRSSAFCRLDLQHNPLGGSIAADPSFTDWLGSDACHLEVLLLRNCDLTRDDGEALGRALSQADCPLSTLDVRMNMLGLKGAAALLEAAQRSTRLHRLLMGSTTSELDETVNVADTQAFHDALERVCTKSRSLRELDITGNALGADLLAQIVGRVHTSSLTRLDARRCSHVPQELVTDALARLRPGQTVLWDAARTRKHEEEEEGQP